MFGLDGEGIVRRIRALARDRAAGLGLRPAATDAELETAARRVLHDVTRDRKLRRFFRDPRSHDIAGSLVTWEVVLHVVGRDHAEARFAALRGLPPPEPPSPRSEGIAESAATAASATAAQLPPADSPRRIMRRPRRLPEPRLPDALADLLEAVSVEANTPTDPRYSLGYDHAVWLEEWLELAVGAGPFDALEAAVAAHGDVVGALHEDREQLFVAAPSLHPEDVRTIVIDVLARDFDPTWPERV